LLSDTAKIHINHYSDANRMVFETLLGVEIAFEVVIRSVS